MRSSRRVRREQLQTPDRVQPRVRVVRSPGVNLPLFAWSNSNVRRYRVDELLHFLPIGSREPASKSGLLSERCAPGASFSFVLPQRPPPLPASGTSPDVADRAGYSQT